MEGFRFGRRRLLVSHARSYNDDDRLSAMSATDGPKWVSGENVRFS